MRYVQGCPHQECMMLQCIIVRHANNDTASNSGLERQDLPSMHLARYELASISITIRTLHSLASSVHATLL